jgi:O-antigen/teichoic acid export membrane protein
MLSSSVFAMCFSLLITFFLAKLLAPEKLGILMTAEAFIDLFRFFFYFGFNNTILKFASEHEDGFKEGLNKAIGNALIIKACITLPLIATILTVSHFTLEALDLKQIIVIYVWVFVLESFSSIFGIARRALGQFSLISGITILNKVLRLATILIVLNYTKDLMILVYAFLAEKVIRLFISWITTKKYIQIKTDFKNIKKMIKDCFGYAFVDPLQGVQNKIDRVMINSFLGPAAVAFYTIPAKISTAIQTLIKTGSSTLSPNLHSSLRKDEENYQNSISHIFRFSNIAAVLSFFFIFFFAKDILILLFGDKYSDSYPIVFLFAYLSAISIAENTPELVFTTKASHKIRVFYKVLSMLINVGLNIIFLVKFGIKGAIYATITANSIRLLVKYWFTREDFNFLKLIYFCVLPIISMHFLNPLLFIILYIIYIVLSKQVRKEDLKRLGKIFKNG